MDVFIKACELSIDNMINSIPITTQEHEFSSEHKKKIREIQNKFYKGKYHKYSKNTIKFLIAVAVILSITTTVFAIEASKRHYINKYNNHSVYSIEDATHNLVVDELFVEYIPTGYSQVEEIKNDFNYQRIYQNIDKNWITILKSVDGADMNFDTEEYEYKEIQINNIKYVIYSSSTNKNGVIWNNGIYVYYVSGNVNEEELIKIAKSVK